MSSVFSCFVLACCSSCIATAAFSGLRHTKYWKLALFERCGGKKKEKKAQQASFKELYSEGGEGAEAKGSTRTTLYIIAHFFYLSGARVTCLVYPWCASLVRVRPRTSRTWPTASGHARWAISSWR